jgi:hypothetical protein
MKRAFEFADFNKSVCDVSWIKSKFTEKIPNSAARGVLLSESCKSKGALMLLNVARDNNPKNYLNKAF